MSGKAFASKVGTTWECCGEYSILFVVLDGHVTLKVTRSVPRVKGSKHRVLGASMSVMFRKYLDLETGKLGQFSKDSVMNKTARRVK